MDNKRGFTLIELLIVVVIIGILAAIAIPRFGETRERAFVSAMTSDLRNIQTLQEQYYFDEDYAYYTGTGTAAAGGEIADLGFVASDGVDIGDFTAAGEGYTVTADHGGTTIQCTLRVGQGDVDGIDCDEPTGDGTG